MKNISLIEKTIQGAWRIYGSFGIHQYMGYSKRGAIRLYNNLGKISNSEYGKNPRAAVQSKPQG